MSIFALWALAKLRGLWDFVKANPLPFVILLLCAASIVAWKRGDRYRDKLETVLAAQVKAGTAQAEANHAPVIAAQAVVEKSNAEAPAYYDRVRTVSKLVYRDAHCPGPAPVPGADPNLASLHGPDPDTVLVPAADYDQLTYATARALRMQAEAQELISLGVLVGE